MKRHRALAAGLGPSIVKIALISTPSTAMAMGGEGLATGLIILAFWFVIWLILSAVSFIPKTKPRTIERYTLWAIRLCVPVWVILAILDHEFIDPYIFAPLRVEFTESLKNSAKQEFNNLCEKHTPQATQILQVVNTERPKSLFIDEPDDLSGLDVNLELAKCVTKKLTPACSGMKLESIEWNWHNTISPCRNGVVPDTKRCLQEYNRYDLGEGKFNHVEIDQPTSAYVIRVDKAIEAGEGFKRIRKYQITLETKEARQALAKTEILASHMSPPCPNAENEVAKMLLQVFPQQ